jgi:hypothetical protein
MQMRDIPTHEWPGFFDGFSRQHDGWLASIEVLGADIGDQIESREQPLRGITAELGMPGGDAISILLGDTPDKHVTHVVHAPRRVSLEQTDEGADQAVHIEAADGSMTVLRFRVAVLSEALDGYVSSAPDTGRETSGRS